MHGSMFSNMLSLLRSFGGGVTKGIKEVGNAMLQSMGMISSVAINNVLIDVISSILDKQIALPTEETNEKIKKASAYLNDAGVLLSELQNELGEREEKLASLMKSIDEHTADAKHWESLAAIKRESANPLAIEIQEAIFLSSPRTHQSFPRIRYNANFSIPA